MLFEKAISLIAKHAEHVEMQNTPHANSVCLTFYITDIYKRSLPIKPVCSVLTMTKQPLNNQDVKFLRSNSNVGDFNTLFIVNKRQANTL